MITRRFDSIYTGIVVLPSGVHRDLVACYGEQLEEHDCTAPLSLARENAKDGWGAGALATGILARTVLEQDETLTRLRAALIEALDAIENVEIRYGVATAPMTWQRIEELRAMVRG